VITFTTDRFPFSFAGLRRFAAPQQTTI